MKEHFEKAIKYVRDNKTWTKAREQVALENIEFYRCDIRFADESISDKIRDLMEEYGEDNDLPEGWWYEQGNEDDIFFEVIDND